MALVDQDKRCWMLERTVCLFQCSRNIGCNFDLNQLTTGLAHLAFKSGKEDVHVARLVLSTSLIRLYNAKTEFEKNELLS